MSASHLGSEADAGEGRNGAAPTWALRPPRRASAVPLSNRARGNQLELPARGVGDLGGGATVHLSSVPPEPLSGEPRHLLCLRALLPAWVPQGHPPGGPGRCNPWAGSRAAPRGFPGGCLHTGATLSPMKPAALLLRHQLWSWPAPGVPIPLLHGGPSGASHPPLVAQSRPVPQDPPAPPGAGALQHPAPPTP